MPESDVLYHTDQGFWEKRDLIPKEPRRLHPWDFAGETQAVRMCFGVTINQMLKYK